MVAYTKPQQIKKERSVRPRGERDQIELIDRSRLQNYCSKFFFREVDFYDAILRCLPWGQWCFYRDTCRIQTHNP